MKTTVVSLQFGAPREYFAVTWVRLNDRRGFGWLNRWGGLCDSHTATALYDCRCA